MPLKDFVSKRGKKNNVMEKLNDKKKQVNIIEEKVENKIVDSSSSSESESDSDYDDYEELLISDLKKLHLERERVVETPKPEPPTKTVAPKVKRKRKKVVKKYYIQREPKQTTVPQSYISIGTLPQGASSHLRNKILNL